MMIVDASRGEIELDELFNAIEHDKDQVAQASDLYGDYLKIKNDETIDGNKKIEILQRILQLQCMEKTNAQHNNHENERARINLKWTVLTECGIWYRKLSFYDKAIVCFEKANTINNRVSTIYYEMGMCYFELGNIYQVKTCFEKTIEISHEHTHWKCLEQIICLYFLLGNFSKCLEYIRIGYDRVATYQSIYDFGQICLMLLQRKQPSMKMLIGKMFEKEMEYVIEDENLGKKVEELEGNLKKLKEKLFKINGKKDERRKNNEHVVIESFQDFGQHLLKKLREFNGDSTKLSHLIDVQNFIPKTQPTTEKEEQPTDQPAIVTEEPPSQPAVNRKKRSLLPLNLDDYEKRRSARSTTRLITDDSNIGTVEKFRRILSNDDSSSEDETDETVISPDDDIAPTIVSDLPRETFPTLQIEWIPFIQSIEQISTNGYHFHYIDLISAFVNELIKHSSTFWSNEMRMIFMKLFDCLLDHVQYSTTDIESNHLQACLCYVENAIGSAKSDLSEDSIERFSCFARLKIKYKSLGYCFAKLQLYLYLLKTSAIQGKLTELDQTFYRVLWISSLYYFLSDSQDDALACIYQLLRLYPETETIILPNLFNHTTISRSTIESLYLRLKDNEQTSSSSSSQELTYILSRIAVAEEKDELASLIKKLEKKIKLFYANLSSQMHLQQKSLIKCYETLVNVLKENQHLNEKENVHVRKIFDQIFIQIIDMIIKLLDEDSQWKDRSLKTIEKLTLNLIDAITKRDSSGNHLWPFKSTNPWILVYRVTIKRDSKKNEQFLVSYIRAVHELFGKQEKCLIENGSLLEYFLLELIQIEHPDIRKRLFSNTINEKEDNESEDEANEQKSKLSKVMDEIEQCIYCLYGLVLRKSKMKYLNDHHCSSLELTLNKASIVFYALRPRQLPGYEGRASTITNETESLFQRFESMIEWDGEREERRQLLISYISDATSINSQGQQSEELMHLSDKPFQSNTSLFERDLYYLFADYYLKMASKDAAANESSNKKAQDYYMKDLCLNTRRFDSWAGLTVIEFAKIEEFVTADDFDPQIFNVHMSASCFFRQAVSVDSNNHTLWMEYAEITYILQAYCSKYKDKAAVYVPDRSFLLNICKEAYEKANVCTDNDENKEDWTYLYMMAKIEEKLHRNELFEPLKKYVAALDLLHENKAVYPRKLGHHTATSNSKGMLLGCHAVEMFYRIHASTLKYLNRHSKESAELTLEKLNEMHQFLTDMQTKPFSTSYYEKSTIPSDAHSAQLIRELYFPNQTNLLTDPWLIEYTKCIWLCIEGLYLCVARYNRHYRGLYRLAHFFHTNEYYRNDRLSLEFLLGGKALELKNYPKIIGLFQERSKHNLFNGIWRIQPLEAERTGSFNASMYKSTRLFVDLLLQSDEHSFVLFEVLRQLLDKPDPEKKYLREVERRMLCQHSIKNLSRIIKKKVLLRTRDDIERERVLIMSSIEDNDPNNIQLPSLFEIAIKFYTLMKNYPAYCQNTRLDELVELTFQRYRSILKFSSHLPENPKAENLILIYTPKKVKPKVKRPTTTESAPVPKRQCIEQPAPPPPPPPSRILTTVPRRIPTPPPSIITSLHMPTIPPRTSAPRRTPTPPPPIITSLQMPTISPLISAPLRVPSPLPVVTPLRVPTPPTEPISPPSVLTSLVESVQSTLIPTTTLRVPTPPSVIAPLEDSIQSLPIPTTTSPSVVTLLDELVSSTPISALLPQVPTPPSVVAPLEESISSVTILSTPPRVSTPPSVVELLEESTTPPRVSTPLTSVVVPPRTPTPPTPMSASPQSPTPPTPTSASPRVSTEPIPPSTTDPIPSATSPTTSISSPTTAHDFLGLASFLSNDSIILNE